MSMHNASRRELLRLASKLSFMGTATPFAMNLAMLNAASAQSSDYKALVCLFLFGGNDHGNTVLATDSASWTEYQRFRSTAPDPITLRGVDNPLDDPSTNPQVRRLNSVLPIVPNTAQSGRTFALHPCLNEVKALFDAGRLAVVPNVGPLRVPTTRAQFQAQSVPLPPKLFSHNDQQSTWQAYAPEGARYGWGGRMGDLLKSQNTQTTFTCISAAGNAVWLAGQDTVQYQVGSNGATAIGGLTGTLFGSSAAPAMLRTMITADRSHLLEAEYNRVTKRAIDAQALLNSGMLPANGVEAVPNSPGTTQANGLAGQLATVARIIGGRSALGASRQVFFVSMGGFDTHDNQNVQHANLMARLGQAIAYFDRVTTALGVNDKVTLFTASDFGRTFTSNGDGTDHGWGAHHFVSGGAVRGKDLYGRFPTLGVNTNDDVGQGRLIPEVSVDQYAGTLASWFGVPAGSLSEVFPHLNNFDVSKRNLGFML
jgi:uncharacterized protein (DUF1501 family)